MGQAEILKLLQKKREPLPARKIAELLNVSISAVKNALKRLKKYDEIKSIEKIVNKRWVVFYFVEE